MKFAFWRTVADCLVEFFDVKQDEASAMVERLLGKIVEDGGNKSDRDLIYHSEPIHVASDLMGREPIRDGAFYERYRRIQGRNLKIKRGRALSQVDARIFDFASLPAGGSKRLTASVASEKSTSRSLHATRMASTR
jgi:hypothetical protein